MQNSRDYNDPLEASGRSGRLKLWILRGLVFILPVLVIAAAVFGTVAMSGLKPEPEEKEDIITAIPVLTERATRENVTLEVKSQGDVQPRVEIEMTSQVGGRISYIAPQFIEGGQFKKGEVLVRIEPREYELRVTQARAEVTQAQTIITREESEALIALRDWQELGRGGQPSALSLRKPQMAEAQANLEAAKARLGEMELQLERTYIRAPFDGRVVRRDIDVSGFVTAGMTLGEVYADDVMDIRLPLTHEQLRRIGVSLGYQAPKGGGIDVIVSANVAGTYSQWPAKIVRTDSRFNRENRVLFVYAEVRDPFKHEVPLAPGLFVEARIAGQDLKDMVIIPRAALRGDNRVYVANDDETLSIKSVTTISTNREQAILSAGLISGEAVITSPIRGAADGMKIDVVEPADRLNKEVENKGAHNE